MTRLSPLLLTALALAGCSSTTQRPEDPAGIAVEAVFRQTSRLHAGADAAEDAEDVSVVLRDARGRALENDSVGVEVNGVRLPLHVVRGYLDRYPAYGLPRDTVALRLHPDSAYHVVVLWPDGRRLPAGALRTPRRLDAAQLVVAPAPGGALRVGWRGVAEPAWLEGFAAFGTRDSTGARLHGTTLPVLGDGGREVRGDGAVDVDAAMLRPRAEGEAYVVSATLTATTEAAVPAPFRRGSRLRAERRVAVEVVPP